MNLILFFVLPMALGLWAQHKVTSTFRRYSQQPASVGRTGAEVARAILDRNGLTDVQVLATPGELSDHYDPRSRTVNLSEPVYGVASVSAMSVAAHEVGHAIQHAHGYAPLAFRSALFPVAALGSNLAPMLILGGMILTFVIGMTGALWLALIGIALYAFAVLFQLVTLPVEFDASSRAKRQLQELQLVTAGEGQGTAKVLNAAAMTYVAGALAAVAQLLWFAQMFLGGDE